MASPTDYDGAIVVVADADRVLMIHPGGDIGGPVSLPGNPCRPGEHPAEGAVRIVHELTGLVVTVVRPLTTFVQEGTPTGTMLAHGFLARPT